MTQQELEKVVQKEHLEKTVKRTKNCFVSPVVVTIKRDKLVKLSLDSRKLNKSFIKRKATLPSKGTIEEIISNILARNKKSDGKIWMSKIDLDYAYGQAKLSKEASKHCVQSIKLYGALPI